MEGNGTCPVLYAGPDSLESCPGCDLGRVCKPGDSVGKMSPLCLDGVATVGLVHPRAGPVGGPRHPALVPAARKAI